MLGEPKGGDPKKPNKGPKPFNPLETQLPPERPGIIPTVDGLATRFIPVQPQDDSEPGTAKPLVEAEQEQAGRYGIAKPPDRELKRPRAKKFEPPLPGPTQSEMPTGPTRKDHGVVTSADDATKFIPVHTDRARTIVTPTDQMPADTRAERREDTPIYQAIMDLASAVDQNETIIYEDGRQSQFYSDIFVKITEVVRLIDGGTQLDEVSRKQLSIIRDALNSMASRTEGQKCHEHFIKARNSVARMLESKSDGPLKPSTAKSGGGIGSWIKKIIGR